MRAVPRRPALPADEPTAVAIVRAWFDGGPQRVMKVRVTNAVDAGPGHRTIGVATDPSGACRIIEAWLTDFEEAHRETTPIDEPDSPPGRG